jgi:hypothetical protein
MPFERRGPMISVIDNTSTLRHACFNALATLGHPVVAFHSPETFVNSGAIYNSNLLILGRTRLCPSKCEALQWASAIRPNLRTLLLHPDCIELRHLLQICKSENGVPPDADSSLCLNTFWRALESGVLLRESESAFKQLFARIDAPAT